MDGYTFELDIVDKNKGLDIKNIFKENIDVLKPEIAFYIEPWYLNFLDGFTTYPVILSTERAMGSENCLLPALPLVNSENIEKGLYFYGVKWYNL